MKRRSHLLPLGIGGFFIVLDRVCKYLAQEGIWSTTYLIDPWIGWEYYANPGIAFGIPLPNALIIIATPIILLLFLAAWQQKKSPHPSLHLGISLLFFGALSNFADRLLYNITIDYIRIYKSVFNIADIMIILGALLFGLFYSRTRRELCSPQSIPPRSSASMRDR